MEAVYLPDCMSPELTTRERLHILNTTVNLSSNLQVCATGALLTILSSHHLVRPFSSNHPPNSIPVASIHELASLHNYLIIDPTSLEALNIFKHESHPSAMGLGQSKEGLSVFGVLNRCVTVGGRRLLRLWFTRPLLDRETIEERLNAIACLMSDDGEYRDIVDGVVRQGLRGVKDPLRNLTRLQCMQTLPDVHEFIAYKNSLDALCLIEDGVKKMTAKKEDSEGTFSAPGGAPPPTTSGTATGTSTKTATATGSTGRGDIFDRFLSNISHHDLVSGIRYISNAVLLV